MMITRNVRTKPRHELRPARVVLAGLLTTAVIIGFLILAENSYNGVPGLNYRTVYVSLPNIGHLKQHDPVDIAGVRVGQVLRTSTADNRAKVELQLRGVGALPQDTKAVVRAQGLLGERYVDLQPGKSQEMLPNGATITEGDHTYTDGVPETLDLFDARTRIALRQMTRGLGEGLEGRGADLNQAIKVGPQSGANFDTAAYAILSRKAAAENFFPALNGGFAALNTAKDDFANMMRPAAITAEAFADRRSALQEAISLMPTWFPVMVEGIGTLQHPRGGINLFNAVNDLAGAVRPVAPSLPGDLRSAATLLEQAADPLARTKPVFDEVPHAVPAALGILDALKPDLPRLNSLFEHAVKPVTQLSIHGCDIQNFATGTRSMVSWGQSPGGNFGPNVGFPLTIVAGPQEANQYLDTKIPYPTENPYPAACEYAPGPTITEDAKFQLRSGFPR